MKPIKTCEVLTDIYAIATGIVNFYLVKTTRKYIAFDAGASASAAIRELGKLNVSPDDITAVFLTHTDSDHTGAIGLFKQAKVFISKQEEPMVNGGIRRSVFLGFNKLKCPYETLEDGGSVNIDGINIKCIVTPGHTKGSACYIADGKYLFSGDNFAVKDGKARPFTALFNMDGKEHRRSIVKISGFESITAVFTGHYGYCDNFSKAFQNWRA